MVRPGEVAMFLMELAAYVGVAWWAYHLREGSVVGVLYALAAIAVMGLVWAVFASPQARFPLYGTPRIAFEIVWFGLAVAAFLLSGLAWAGVLLALAFVVALAYRLRAMGR